MGEATESSRLLGEQPRTSRTGRVIRNFLGLEIAMSVMAGAQAIHSIIVTNLYLDKVCRVNLGLPPAVCSDLNSHQQATVHVQSVVSRLELYSSLLAVLPCLLTSTVLAAWSDSTGRRKPLIIIPSLGGILTLGAYTLNVYHTSWPAEGLLLSSVYSLFGGYTTSLLGTYTFLAASTPPHQRTSRIALLHVCSTVGWVAGTMASPGIFHSWGYTGTFITSLVFASTGLALTSLLLTEPPLALRPPDNSPPSHSPLQGLLQAYRCLVKRRPGNTRCSMFLLLSAMLLLVTAACGGDSYLFSRRMFQWTEDQYSLLSTLSSLLSSAASLFLLPLLSLRLQVPDQVLGLLATASGFLDLLVTSLCQTGTGFVFARCLGLLQGQASMAIRSLLSKLVPPTDLGKIYVVLGSLEILVPLCASPVFTVLYTTSLDSWPGLVYAVAAALVAAAWICFCLVTGLLRGQGRGE